MSLAEHQELLACIQECIGVLNGSKARPDTAEKQAYAMLAAFVRLTEAVETSTIKIVAAIDRLTAATQKGKP